MVYDGEEIVESQYCSWQGQRVLWRAEQGNNFDVCQCQNWWIREGLKKKTDFVNIDSFWDILNLAAKIYNVRHAWTLKEISKTREGVHTGDDNGTLHEWKLMGLTYSKFWLFDLLGSSEI